MEPPHPAQAETTTGGTSGGQGYDFKSREVGVAAAFSSGKFSDGEINSLIMGGNYGPPSSAGDAETRRQWGNWSGGAKAPGETDKEKGIRDRVRIAAGVNRIYESAMRGYTPTSQLDQFRRQQDVLQNFIGNRMRQDVNAAAKVQEHEALRRYLPPYALNRPDSLPNLRPTERPPYERQANEGDNGFNYVPQLSAACTRIPK